NGVCPEVNSSNATVTVIPNPTINLGTSPSVCRGTTSASLPYSGVSGIPDRYSVDFDAAAEAQGFVDVTNQTLPANQIAITVPANALAGTYDATLKVRNSTTTCESVLYNFTVTVNPIVPASVSVVSDALNDEICVGETVTFTATATNGGGSPVYQWKVNGVNVGVNSDTYTTTTLGNNDVVSVVMTSSLSTCVTGSPATSNTITMKVKSQMTVTGPTISNATICINTSLTSAITHGTSGATGIDAPGVTGLPPGMTAAWVANTVRITGAPTAIGTYSYTIPLTGGCGNISATGTITVLGVMVASAPIGDLDVCIDDPLGLDITHTTTAVTSIGVYNGFPSGVTPAFDATTGTITISGVPLEEGVFNYEITLIGGCGTDKARGTITVNPLMTVSLPSARPVVCLNAPIPSAITHTTKGGVTGINSLGLPDGVNAVLDPASGIITISGTPVGGVQSYSYEIELLGGCGTAKAEGEITVTDEMSAGTVAGLPATICVNSALPSGIKHSTVNATGIGIPFGLPAGVEAQWNPSTNEVEIVGTPTETGTFDYEIPLDGGCGIAAAVGTLVVLDTVTVGLASDVSETCVNTLMPAITHDISGVSGLGTSVNNFGLPLGVNANISLDGKTLVISGTPVQPGEYTYAVNLVGTCGGGVARGTIRVKDDVSVGLPSVAAATVCVGSSLNEIIHITKNATGLGALSTTLPAGVTPTWSGDTLRISGTPLVAGTFNYRVEVKGACGVAEARGTINVQAISVDPVALGTNIFCQDDVVTTSPNVNAAGIVRWYTSPSGGTSSSNTPSIVTRVPGTFTYYVTQQLPNECESRRVPVVVKVNAKPRVDAGPDRRIDLGQSVLLNATASGVNTSITWSPPTGLSNRTIAKPTASPRVTTVYTIRVVTSDGCVGEDTVRVVVLQPLDIPNVFSPNGDGVHDKWIIPKVEQYPNCVVQIFNRYGVKVYDQRGYNVSNA
ncbi:MAG: gliding motility-associated C-terminal domain-containing protein, partial [Bacteroidota bacterium]